jgi:tetraprenyl-beta-curcumene synthase
VFPVVQHEIRRLHCRARRIPDPALRALAFDAQKRKWASLEGAAAFAVFTPRLGRFSLARLLVDLQGVFDYADTLMEQPSPAPASNARRLHHAFVAALQPDLPHSDYYQHHAHRDDGGYLIELIDGCRTAVRALPAYAVVADAVSRHAWRVVFYQSRVNLASASDHPALALWASKQPAGSKVRWWELGAACGSSLAIFAHLAAAADPSLTLSEVEAIEALYWPWAEALHIMLDSLIDRAEDTATDQRNLLDYYASQEEMVERLGLLACEMVRRAEAVPPHHRLILAGMVALYLSDEQAWIPSARPASESILEATGTFARPALALLRLRRLALRSDRALSARHSCVADSHVWTRGSVAFPKTETRSIMRRVAMDGDRESPSVRLGLETLAQFDGARVELDGAAIERLTGMSCTSARDCLTNLSRFGYVIAIEDRGYRLAENGVGVQARRGGGSSAGASL